MEFHLKNPDASRYWKARLIWLMDNEPELVGQMFQRPVELMTYLDEQATQAEAQESRLLKAGNPRDVAEEIVMSMVAPGESMNLNVEPMPEPMRRKIRQWASDLPDRTHVTTA